MWGSPNRGITIYFAQKLSAKHRGQKSYGGKSLRGKKSSGAKVLGGKCSRGQKSSVVNVRGQMCRGGGGGSPAGKCLAGKSPIEPCQRCLSGEICFLTESTPLLLLPEFGTGRDWAWTIIMCESFSDNYLSVSQVGGFLRVLRFPPPVKLTYHYHNHCLYMALALPETSSPNKGPCPLSGDS